jgi:hypothetical protein
MHPILLILGPGLHCFSPVRMPEWEATVGAAPDPGSTKYYLRGAVWVAQGRTSPRILLRFTGLPWLAA